MESGEVTSERSAVTAALVAWGRGDSGAADRLLELVYPELHRIAVRQMRRERSGHTLQPTALVHEAYLKLVDQTRRRLAEPRALPRRRGAGDAPPPGRPRARARARQARRRAPP